MRAFVTGATGFIGLHLCRALVARGDEVVALVRNPEKATQLPPGVSTLRGDLSILADPSTELPACDVIIHLAGVVAAQNPREYEAINYGAVKNLIDCIGRQRQKPRRLLFTSSLAAAGPSSPDVPHTEDHPLRPIDPYGDAKARAEALMSTAKVPTTVFRPPIVLGPGDPASITLYKAAQSGLGFRVAGKPRRLSFVDVRDLVSAILLMADDTRTTSYVYYASHPEPVDVVLLWEELAKAVGRSVFVAPVPTPALHVASFLSTAFCRAFGWTNQLDRKQVLQMTAPAFLCSSDRLRNDLGWAPQYGLAEALQNAARGYREAGWLKS